MKIAIIFGGISFERNISIKTAKSILLNVDNQHDMVEIDFNGSIDKLIDEIKINKAELVFNALHGGDGENGVVQKALEENNIPFTGSSSSACKKAINKAITRDICIDNDIPVPEGYHITGVNDIEVTLQQFFNKKGNVVIKPVDEGSSADLYIFPMLKEESDDLSRILIRKIKFMLKKYGELLLEQYIPGRELTVAILDNKVLPIVEISPKENFYDYECKYTDGMSEYLVPAKLNFRVQKEIEENALKLYNVLGCRHYSRIDIRLDDENNIYILEINTLPGMTQTSLFPKAATVYGIKFRKLINKIINLAK